MLFLCTLNEYLCKILALLFIFVPIITKQNKVDECKNNLYRHLPPAAESV